MNKQYFTSEQVFEGHPDKVADQIADRILDEYIKQDPKSRVACEVTVAQNMINIFGEITSEAHVDIKEVARNVVREIGYDNDALEFNADTADISINIVRQSPDIALGVDRSLEEKQGLSNEEFGAGDQGMMFGYACKESEEYMPLPIYLSNLIAKKCTFVRKSNVIPYLRPDGKCQVTVEYVDGRPVRVDSIVVSVQHDPDVTHDQIEADIIKHVIQTAITPNLIDSKTTFLINPTGAFVKGGPAGDSGLTGRKIIADTYGGYGRHGGGAFSGKDATKVDRSGAYAARYIAKNIVANDLADKCEVQLSYAIGVAEPVSVYIETFSTEKKPLKDIERMVKEHIDLKPKSIIEKFQLTTPLFSNVSVYGHFGENAKDMPWEKLNML